nr:MAG TPA: hypothetical protein [Caudoviricetes sp.]
MTRRAPHRELRLIHPMKPTLTTPTTRQGCRGELLHRRVKHTANLLVQLTPHLQVTHRIATNSEHTQTPRPEPRRVTNAIPGFHVHNIQRQRCPRLLTRTTSRARTIRRIRKQRDKRRIPLNRIPARRLTLIHDVIFKQLSNNLSKLQRNLRRQPKHLPNPTIKQIPDKRAGEEHTRKSTRRTNPRRRKHAKPLSTSSQRRNPQTENPHHQQNRIRHKQPSTRKTHSIQSPNQPIHPHNAANHTEHSHYPNE